MPPLLRLLQISDSAFPTGSFSHSMALEAFHEAGRMETAEDLERAAHLHLSSMATSDCVALRASCGAELGELFRVDRILTATKPARELRQASASTGRRFLLGVSALGVEGDALARFTGAAREGRTPGNLAVGYGVAAPALGLGVEEAVYAYLYAGAASMVAAGQKLIPLGGSAAQRVLFGLGDGIEGAARMSETVEAEDMHAFAPTIDALSMLHERQRTRLYIS
ncbi:MAG TPA: urease accessory UreF family protein [Rubrobacter sp.]|nr:urease accessory UreF family protein [Rubrobacter sp.]